MWDVFVPEYVPEYGQPNTIMFYLVQKTAQGSVCDKEGGQSHDVQKIVERKL
jgi:hypothetical protein